MGSYEAELMKQLDEQEEKLNRMKRTRKGFRASGDGCYSTRGSHTDDEDREWDYGYRALIQVVGKKKAKTIANNFSELCSSFSMKYYYRRSASKDVFVRAGAKKAIIYALLYEIEKSTGKKLRGDQVFNEALQNMFDAEMFFRENDWCANLCGISGTDILSMIRESEGITSQKKHVA